MVTLAIIGMTIFVILLFSMSITAGTKTSISALAKEWRWLLLLSLWSQILLLPQMLTITPEFWKILPVLGTFGIIICGGASVFNKEDELIHIIAAAVTFVCFFGWIMLLNEYYLLPLIICLAAGKDKWKWRLEVGLITGVYLTLLESFKLCL